jgi:hypothetical protein
MDPLPIVFVKPDTTTLHLSNGHAIVVRRRLTTGEERAGFKRAFEYDTTLDRWRRRDPVAVQMAKITSYILDWTFVHFDGEKVAIRESLAAPPDPALIERYLNDMDFEVFDEVRRLIDEHEAAQGAARAAEKKTRAGAPSDDPTSNLPSAVVGELIGSAT